MKTVGITAEYDPFHNGHLYQMTQAVERTGADHVVVVLGGDFLQRGRPGIFSRETRTRMALEAGADLVIQLPYIYSCNSGSEYAEGAVRIMNGLGCVDCISFGSESGDPALLEKAASVSLDSEDAKQALQFHMDQGVSYPEAVTRTVEQLAGEKTAAVLRRPNNLLGVEYLRALRKIKSDIKPVIISRTELLPMLNGTGSFSCSETGLKSAGEIRQRILDGKAGDITRAVPEAVNNIICSEITDNAFAPGVISRNMLKLLLYRIRTSDRAQLAEIYTVSEGVEARIMESALGNPATMEDLIDLIGTKRYTRARIRRMLAHVLMGFRTGEFERLKGTAYARVLGFSDKGRKLLRDAGKKSDIPVISNLNGMDRYDENVRRCLELDIRAADLAAMLRGQYDLVGNQRRMIPQMRIEK